MDQGVRTMGHDARVENGEVPSPDVVAFIRFCHRRRGLRWPEIYDEMCGVAARREFNGWDHAELAARGVSFSLFDMPRLAAWVRAVLSQESSTAPTLTGSAAARVMEVAAGA
jgi:hypothetical protein